MNSSKQVVHWKEGSANYLLPNGYKISKILLITDVVCKIWESSLNHWMTKENSSNHLIKLKKSNQDYKEIN